MTTKTEKKIVTEFEKHIYKKYGHGTFYYNVYETAYGKCGMPDVLIKFEKSYLTAHVEIKKHETLKEAVSNLRPTQIGTITELLLADAEVYLLYANGCARGGLSVKDKILWLDRKNRDTQFSGFDSLMWEFVT